MTLDLKGVMQQAADNHSPDLHFQVGQPPIIRQKNGSLTALERAPVLTKEDIDEIVASITTEDQRKVLKEEWQLDFSYHLEGVSRFRVNVYQEYHGPAISFRLIPDEIPTMEDLALDDVIKTLAMMQNGMILVTGPTGSGKSTVIASIIDYINKKRSAHVITIEDPIEFLYKSDNCLFSQRELNVHTHTFAGAIRAALRQDPDIVMVGEMRDLETISAAITLAETGHLVFSTLHTNDAAQTIDRIIDVFPANQQQQIRSQLSGTLRGVISQTLVPRVDGIGRVAAREIMIVNDAIQNCIQKAETNQIYSIMQINADQGMRLMDDSLQLLVQQGVISVEDAVSHASDSESLYQKLTP
ncbi:type IV pilus twitching motility protein PilT [Candidatus Peregrinibacteria bacterium]|nr:type IV pilus twitching motility protein PilT [Candidatus Peregrinibacteria bacterium]